MSTKINQPSNIHAESVTDFHGNQLHVVVRNESSWQLNDKIYYVAIRNGSGVIVWTKNISEAFTFTCGSRATDQASALTECIHLTHALED
jgi:hypothetical protein